MLEADVEVDRREFTLRAAIAVAPGERVALFGPSGAGKTTLLETIAGLVYPRTGTVSLAGRVLTRTGRPRVDVPPWQRRIGLLRQDPGLFPHLSVRDNLCYARNADSHSAELTSLAAALGLSDLLAAMPARLSGGQRSPGCCSRTATRCCSTSPTPGWTRRFGGHSLRWSSGWLPSAAYQQYWWHMSWRTRRLSLPRWRSSTPVPCCK